jgi:O-antigen/teichoic acid export membrane protein
LSNIRVTYTGLIALITSLIGVFTGTVFVIIVTRRLTPDDFGLWTLIGTVISYVLVVEPIISYWTTRQISRGENVGRSALTTSGIFSIGGLAAYFGIAVLVYFTSEIDILVLVIASFLVPVNFLTNTLSSISLGHKPQAISYSTIAFESSKTPLGIIFVILIPLGIIGVLITTILASLIQMSILLWMSREKLLGELKKIFIKFWIKLSWLPLYFSSSGLIYKFDILIYTTLTSSFIGPAYWGVSIAAAKLVGLSIDLSQGLYSKIIATGKTEVAKENIKQIMFLAIPFLAVSIVFAKPILHILNPIYIDGIYIVYFLAIRTFLAIPMTLSYKILQASEKIDLDKNATFKHFVKSKLFLIPSFCQYYTLLF